MSPIRSAVLYASHTQFYLQDVAGQRAAEEDDDYDWPETWSEEAVAVHRIGVDGPCSIAVGTERYDHVETSFQLHPAEPGPLEADHIVEADLAVPTGAVHIFGCVEPPGPQHRVEVPAGPYRVRVSYVPSEPPPVPVNEGDPGPHYRYHLDLWPSATSGGVRVVRLGRR